MLVNNVFYFTQRVVDKLWQGMFNKESKLLIDFIIQLIAQVCTFQEILASLFLNLFKFAVDEHTDHQMSFFCRLVKPSHVFFSVIENRIGLSSSN